jgi:hypothetical protein
MLFSKDLVQFMDVTPPKSLMMKNQR